jgi:hypothetical protein
MKNSMCAYKRGEPFFTSYHWCNECPPMKEYLSLEKTHKADWAKRNTTLHKKKVFNSLADVKREKL